MGKRKTQRNIDAAGKKRRKLSEKQLESLQKAQTARKMRAVMIKQKRRDHEHVGKTIVKKISICLHRFQRLIKINKTVN